MTNIIIISFIATLFGGCVARSNYEVAMSEHNIILSEQNDDWTVKVP